jgi:hypothetical protein
MATSRSHPTGGDETPRWVKVFGFVTIVAIVAFVILHLAGGGPGRHMAP